MASRTHRHRVTRRGFGYSFGAGKLPAPVPAVAAKPAVAAGTAAPGAPVWLNSLKVKDAFDTLTSTNPHGVLTHSRFFLFLRPLLTNSLTLSDAYAVFLNLARRAQRERTGSSGSAAGRHGTAATATGSVAAKGAGAPDGGMHLRLPQFKELLERLAHIKFGGSSHGSLGRFLAEIISSKSVVLRVAPPDDFLRRFVSGATVAATVELEPRLQAMFAVDAGAASWAECVEQTRTVAWRSVQVRLRRGRIVPDLLPEGVARKCFAQVRRSTAKLRSKRAVIAAVARMTGIRAMFGGDGAAAGRDSDTRRTSRASRSRSKSDAMIDEVVESDSGSDSDDVSDSSLRPLNMPSYAEFWARLAYELMRLNERADVQAVSAYHASLKAAALSAAADRFRPVGESDGASGGGSDSGSGIEPPTMKRVQGLHTNMRKLVALVQDDSPANVKGGASSTAASAAGSRRPSLQSSLAFGLGAPLVAGVGPPQVLEPEDIAHGWSDVQQTMAASIGAGTLLHRAATRAQNRAGRPSSARSFRARPDSARGARNRVAFSRAQRPSSAVSRASTYSAQSMWASDPAAVAEKEMLTTQNLTQLAASLRNDPNPYQDLRLGVGPQPLRDTSQMEPLKYRPPADGGGKKGSKKKKSGGKKSSGKKGGKKGKKKAGKVDKAAAQAHANELLARFSAPLFSPQQLEARRSYRALIASDAVATKAELEAAKAKKPLHKAPSLHRKLAELSVMRVASSEHARASSPTLGRVRASSPSPTPSPASSPLRHPGRPFFDHDDAVAASGNGSRSNQLDGSGATPAAPPPGDGSPSRAMGWTVRRTDSNRSMVAPAAVDQAPEAVDDEVVVGDPAGDGNVAPANRPMVLHEMTPAVPAIAPDSVATIMQAGIAFHNANMSQRALEAFEDAEGVWREAIRERDNIGAHVRRSEIALPAAGFIFLRLIMGAAHLSGNADHLALKAFVEAKGKLTKIPSNLPLWASTMGHLGVAAYYCNQFEIAARCFGLAMHNRIENVGESHCDTLAAQHNLGCALVMAGEGSEAIVALSKASSGLNSSVGPTHVRAAVATRNLMKARRHAANFAFSAKPLSLQLRPDIDKMLTNAVYHVKPYTLPKGFASSGKKKGKKKKGGKKKKKKR